MNNIIRNCDNNCSDYQNRTFTVTLTNSVNSQGATTYSACKFGRQITLPEVNSTTTRDFIGWEESGTVYPAGTIINVQSDMTFNAKFSEAWVKVWEGSAINSVVDADIVAGRATRISATVTSYYRQYDGCDGCYCYAVDERTETVTLNNEEISTSSNYSQQTTVGNARFVVSAGKISVVLDDRAEDVVDDMGESELPDGGRVVFNAVYQFNA